MANVIRVAVTGAAGQVAYAMLGRLASGEVFGKDAKVILQLLEIGKPADWQPPPANPKAKHPLDQLEGVAMELFDCGFSTLKDVLVTSDVNAAFRDCNWALLVGAAPRGPGETRGDLIRKNGPIFVTQGKALAQHAAPDVRILIVGNPCNANCLIAFRNGRAIPAERWTAMTRLDHNRARDALARKAGVGCEAVTNVTIWGNHSETQFPDFGNAKIAGKPATEVINDRAWLENAFVSGCQNRGKDVITKRGLSSALSAANGAIDHVKSLIQGTPEGDWVSMATVSQGEYGAPPGLVCGYPCKTDGKGNFTIVQGLKLDAFGQEKFKISLQELEKERDDVKDLLK